MEDPKSKITEDDELRMVNSVRAFLQKDESESSFANSLPFAFFAWFIMHEVHPRVVEHGRLVCSMKVPRHLVNGDNRFHVGAITMLVDLVGAMVVYTVGAPASGVSLEINLSCFEAAYLDEEIEIEATALRVGKSVAVVSVELRKTRVSCLRKGVIQCTLLLLSLVSVDCEVPIFISPYVVKDIYCICLYLIEQKKPQSTVVERKAGNEVSHSGWSTKYASNASAWTHRSMEVRRKM